MKKVLNVFGIILGILFSFALVISLVVTPVLSGATSFFKTENLKKVVNSMDFTGILADTMGEMSAQEAQVMDAFFEEGIVDDFINLYVEDLFAELDGDPTAKKLTPEAVVQIFDDHMDVLVKMAKSQMDADILQYVTDEDIKNMLHLSLEQEAAAMVESFPSLYELGLDTETLTVMGMFRDGVIAKVGIALLIVFTIIVLICQFPRFKGFMWLGVDFIFGGGMTLVVAVSFEVILKTAMATIPFGNAILNPMVESFTGSMKTGALIEFGLAVLFIVIFIVGRKVLKNKTVSQMV